MANVLPNSSLKAVGGFYRTRFVFIGSGVALVCALFALLVLVPAYTAVHSKAGVTSESPQLPASLQTNTDRDDIARAQLLVGGFRPVASSSPSILELLDDVLGVRPDGVLVESINIKRGEAGTITLEGSLDSRGALSTYREALLENPRFKSVSVPLGVLAGTGDDRFTITLTGSL